VIGIPRWGNDEPQIYTAGTANAWIEGNALRIQAKNGNPPTSARLTTRYWNNRTTFKKTFGPYGTMEGRMKGVNRSGTWPAFWMLGTNHQSAGWAACGEIDIMEHANSSANYQGTIHWNNPGWVYYSAANVSANDFAQWHTYSIIWDSSQIRWMRDGAQTGAASILNNVNSTEEFHRTFYLLINHALGGPGTGYTGGQVPVAGEYPFNFDIDYIRWWNGGAPPPTPTTPPSGGGFDNQIRRLRVEHSNKCVDLANAGTANGTRVQQWACNGSNAQKYKFIPTDSGYYRLAANANNAQGIDVVGGATTDGSDLHVWGYGAQAAAQWKPELVTGSWYRLRNRNSQKCMDVPGWNTADGVTMEIYTCNNTTNQKFIIEP
jgi:hypothetical protein